MRWFSCFVLDLMKLSNLCLFVFSWVLCCSICVDECMMFRGVCILCVSMVVSLFSVVSLEVCISLVCEFCRFLVMCVNVVFSLWILVMFDGVGGVFLFWSR